MRSGGTGQRNAADVMQATGLPGELFQFTVQTDGVTLQRGHIGICIQGMKTTRRMPGRSRCQLGAFDQNHIFPAKFSQVIDDAASNYPATDYNHLRMRFHFFYPNTEKLLFWFISRRRE